MCCGNNRSQYRGTTVNPPPPRVASPNSGSQSATPRGPSVTFEYTGQTGLTVKGAVTGRTYRFDHPAARLGVDLRDRPSMAAIRILRQV
jgi:hypothetical protein